LPVREYGNENRLSQVLLRRMIIRLMIHARFKQMALARNIDLITVTNPSMISAVSMTHHAKTINGMMPSLHTGQVVWFGTELMCSIIK
jgi:hypothetical protein